jgi:hypothetical protein
MCSRRWLSSRPLNILWAAFDLHPEPHRATNGEWVGMAFWGVELMTHAGVHPAGSVEVESWSGEEDWRYEGLNGWQIVRMLFWHEVTDWCY